MVRKIVTLVLAIVIILPSAFFFAPRQAQAEDRGLQNYRNAATQNAPMGQLVSTPIITGNTGAATASIAIEVPPGRLGIQPWITLNYNSQSENGLAGKGWSLDLGKIYRSTKFGQPKYDSTDTFVSTGIGSGDLVASGGSYYEKIMHSAAKFTLANNTWIAYDTSGTKYYFGQAPSSQQAGWNSNTFAWYLDRVEDLHGNYFTISYLTDQNTLYPKEIQYTGNSQAVLAPSATVRFFYEARPDASSNYLSGLNQAMAKRLQQIEVLFGGTLARKYVLNYFSAPVDSPLSRLQQVTQYGSDGTSSLPSVTFNYQQNNSTYTNNGTLAASFPAVFSNQQQADPGWRLADVNRDGLLDAVLATADYNMYGYGFQLTSSTKQVYLNTKNGWTLDSAWTSSFPNAYFIIHTKSYYSSGSGMIGEWYEDGGTRFVDVNNDGLQDIVQSRVLRHQKYNGDGLSSATEKNVYINTGSGWTRDGTWSNNLPDVNIYQIYTHEYNAYWGYRAVKGFNEDIGVRFMDINGDGRMDLVRADNYYYDRSNPATKSVYLNTGTGWALNTAWGNAIPEYFVQRTVTHGSAPSYEETRKFRDLGVRMADINGDGLVDIVKAVGTRNYVSCGCGISSDFQRAAYVNSGTGWTYDPTWTNAIPSAFIEHSSVTCGYPSWTTDWDEDTGARFMDINGDGLVDFIRSRTYNGADDRATYINNGSSLIESSWKTPEALITQTDSCTKPNGGYANITRINTDNGIRAEDINGDGIVDFIRSAYSAYYGQVMKSALMGAGGIQQTKPNLLNSINNGIGGVTEFSYSPSTQYYNLSNFDGTGNKNWLGMVIDVVSQRLVKDRGVNQFSYKYNYFYGVFDYQDREYRGFHPVETIFSDGSKVVNYYLQDDAYKGMHYYAYTYDSSGKNLHQQAKYLASRAVRGGTFPYYSAEAQVLLDPNNSASKKTHRINYAYDDYGNTTQVADLGEFSIDTGQNIAGDERTTINEYTYNTAAWIVNRASHAKQLDQNNQKVTESFNFYDSNTDYTALPTKGDLTMKRYWLNTGPTLPQDWPKELFTYDTYGNQLTRVDTNGNKTTMVFDNTQIYPQSTTNPKNQTETFSYDPRFGVLTSYTDPNNVSTTTSYDVFGRPVSVIKPYDNATYPTMTYQYDLTTQPIKVIQTQRIRQGSPPMVFTTVSFYDGFGRLIESKKPAQTSGTILSAFQTYDQRGNAKDSYLPFATADAITTFTIPSGTAPKTTASYDVMNRLVKTNYPDGSASTASFDRWTTVATDQNGHSTTSTADAYGQIVNVLEKNGTSTYTTGYAYDSSGRLVKITDNSGNQTTMSYDSLGRKISMNDPDMGNWTYGYDFTGNLISQTDAKLQTITFTYDPLNRVLTKNYPVASQKVQYTYDDPAIANSKGRLTKVVDPAATTSFAYDQRGRQTSTTKVLNGTTYAIGMAYDSMDRLTATTYPDNEVVSTSYNLQGLPVSVVGTSVYIASASYNAADQLLSLRYGNNALTAYAYDANTARLTHFDTTSGNYGQLQYLNYTYDPVGNVTAINDTKHTATQAFTYDDLNRLMSATGASYGAKTYAYSPIGNITSKEGTLYSYGSAKPHAVTSTMVGPSPQWFATYDANGNMVTETGKNLSYDVDNRLTSVVDTSGLQSVTFAYDWQGSRVKKAVTTKVGQQTTTVTSYYVGNAYEKEGTTIRKHYYLGARKVATRTNGTSLLFFQSDHLGSTNITTDAGGNQVGLTEYMPFGKAYTDSNTTTDYKYNGKELDTETGLYYYGARYYDPTLGRFISADSITPSWYGPQTINRYSYVVNNPIKYVDPTGHFYWEGFVMGGLQTIGGAALTGTAALGIGIAASTGVGVVPALVVLAPVVAWGEMTTVEGAKQMYSAATSDSDNPQDYEVRKPAVMKYTGLNQNDADWTVTGIDFATIFFNPFSGGTAAGPIVTQSGKAARTVDVLYDVVKKADDATATATIAIKILATAMSMDQSVGSTQQVTPTPSEPNKNPLYNPSDPFGISLKQPTCDGTGNQMTINDTPASPSGKRAGGSTSSSGGSGGGSSSSGTSIDVQYFIQTGAVRPST